MPSTVTSAHPPEPPGLPAVAAALVCVAPLAAGADSLAAGLLLGITAMAVLGTTGLFVPRLVTRLPAAAVTPVLFLSAAALVTALQMLCRAFAFDLHLAAGVLLPLAAISAAALAAAPRASGTTPVPSGAGLASVLATAVALAAVGILRGTLAAADLPGTRGAGLGLAAAPAGGLLALGLGVAAWNAMTGMAARRRAGRTD